MFCEKKWRSFVARRQLLAWRFFTLLEGDGKSKRILFMIKWKMIKLITSSPRVVYGCRFGTKS
jgi:hypothetical protein